MKFYTEAKRGMERMKIQIRQRWNEWKKKGARQMAVRLGSLSFGAILLVSLVISVAAAGSGETETVMYDGELLRFHVLANSDREADQTLKLQVRDRILELVHDSMDQAENTAAAEAQLRAQMPQIRAAARAEIQRRGYDYPVSVQLGVFAFPLRQYGNVTLPAGKYPALRVVIGEGGGHNWWCVMFPPLCFVSESTAKMPTESLNKISSGTRRAITSVSAEGAEEDVAAAKDGGIPFEIRFKFLDWLRADGTEKREAMKR